MASDNVSHGLIYDLFTEFRRYVDLEKRFVTLTLAEKLTVILSMVIIIIVMLLFGAMVLLSLLLGLASFIGTSLGSMALGYLVSAAIGVVVMLLFYALRTRLVVNPLARFMSHLFIMPSHEHR